MSENQQSPLEGLQFPHLSPAQSPSTSKTGRDILYHALAAVHAGHAEQAQHEKQWRKNYPLHFKRLVQHGLNSTDAALQIAKDGLNYAQQSFEFYRDGQKVQLKDIWSLPAKTLQTFEFKGRSNAKPEWYVPYQGQKLQGDELRKQIENWQSRGIIESSHAEALHTCLQHPEWFDLSDRTLVLFGAASEAGPLTWLARWKANIIGIDLQNSRVWNKILDTIRQGNATLYAPSTDVLSEETDQSVLAEKLGANLLTQIPEIAQWLQHFPEQLDLASIAYLDGEKHVRVSLAMDAIMQKVSQYKPDSSLMYMCTPTDVYAVPAEVIQGVQQNYQHRHHIENLLSKGVALLSRKHFFQPADQQLYQVNDQQYGISDCLVVEQGPNYALAKRIQQWRATLARSQGQRVSINIAPSTTTRSVTKNPLLKAAFAGADLFGVEAFAPETTNAIMAALWIHDLRNPASVANPEVSLNHPLELMMSAANHGGLWRVPYLARTALPFAALYGFATDNLPKGLLGKLKK